MCAECWDCNTVSLWSVVSIFASHDRSPPCPPLPRAWPDAKRTIPILQSYQGLGGSGGCWFKDVRFSGNIDVEGCWPKLHLRWRWTMPGWSYLALTLSWCWEGPVVQSAASHCSHIPVTGNTPRHQYNGRNNMAGLAFQAFRGLTGPGRDGNITRSSSYHYPPPPHHTGHSNSLCHDI